MKILLVDDDVALLDVTSYALRREGFNVIAATDGAQALRRWESDQPDVVVLDVGLPKLTRFEFRILHLLASNVGRVVSSERLVEYAWGYDGGEASLLKTHICHIRKK